MDFGFDNNIESMLNFFILIAILSLCNITILFLRNNSEKTFWGAQFFPFFFFLGVIICMLEDVFPLVH